MVLNLGERSQQFTADFEKFPLDDCILDQEYRDSFFYIRTFGLKERIIQASKLSFHFLKNLTIGESPTKNKFEEINKESEALETKGILAEFSDSIFQPVFLNEYIIATDNKILGLVRAIKNKTLKSVELLLRIM